MPENILYCSRCGTPNIASATFCQKCGASLGPSLAAAPAVSYPQAVPAAGYGGFWIRLVAAIIDGIILSVATWPIRMLFFAGVGDYFPGSTDGADYHRAVFAVLPAVWGASGLVSWLYEALLTSSPWQGTVGKKVLNLRVTDEAGNRISFARATGRHFAKYLSAMILFIGYIMIAFTDRKRGLHDIIAGTLVRKS